MYARQQSLERLAGIGGTDLLESERRALKRAAMAEAAHKVRAPAGGRTRGAGAGGGARGAGC